MRMADAKAMIIPEIRVTFTGQADYSDYTERFLAAFTAFVGEHGRSATTYAQQYEAARIAAERMVADPRFSMKYQFKDRERNERMVCAMLYWRGYKDILPHDEVVRRAELYISSLPENGQRKISTQIRAQSRMMRPQVCGAVVPMPIAEAATILSVAHD